MNRLEGSERVSVVITCYNQAQFLAEAISSVLAQKRPCDEFLIVDDGSTDNTGEVACRNAAARYTYQHNQGLAAARNTGIRETGGDFLVFLDADDRLTPDAISEGLACFRNKPQSAFVFGRFHLFGEGASAQIPTQSRCPRDPYVGLLEGNFIGMHGTVMYRRGVLADTGGFDISLPVCEDYALYLRIAKDHPIASHDTVVAEYRRHSTNLSNKSGVMLRGVLSLLRRQKELIAGDAGKEAACETGARAWRRALSFATWQYRHPVLSGVIRTSETIRRRLAGLRGASFAVWNG